MQRQTLPEIAVTTSPRVGFGFSASSASAAMIIPGVQKPHWVAKLSRNACWSGDSPTAGVVPSSVVTFEPLIVSTGIRQLMTASPSTWQVHVPHVPTPHPRLAAVRPSESRSALSSVVPGLAMNSSSEPFTSSSMTVEGISSPP